MKTPAIIKKDNLLTEEIENVNWFLRYLLLLFITNLVFTIQHLYLELNLYSQLIYAVSFTIFFQILGQLSVLIIYLFKKLKLSRSKIHGKSESLAFIGGFYALFICLFLNLFLVIYNVYR